MKKKALVLISVLAVCAAFLFAAGCKKAEESAPKPTPIPAPAAVPEQRQTEAPAVAPAVEKQPAPALKKAAKKKPTETRAIIETKFGAIELKFFPDVAPNHVKNFIDLAKKGFYNGTTFHRVIPGFMIQGGDPNTKDADRSMHGKGGPGYTIKAEFNDRPHKRGTLSMARAASPDSAGSQFFICVKDSPFLDRQYTVFGEVVAGMDVVDKIVSQPRDAMDNPNDRIEMKVKITTVPAAGR